MSPDEAFALITEPERLRRWQTVSAYVDLRAGGDFRWTVSPGHVAAGTLPRGRAGTRVVFGWGWEGSDELPPDASTVTVTIEPAPEGSTVTLVHEGLDEKQERAHAEGWDHYLERLERLATTGDAGPDEWAGLPSTADAGDRRRGGARRRAARAAQPDPEDRPSRRRAPTSTAHDVACT